MQQSEYAEVSTLPGGRHAPADGWMDSAATGSVTATPTGSQASPFHCSDPFHANMRRLEDRL